MLEIYEHVNDLQGFIKLMGEAIAGSGLYGCKNVQQGAILAWHCVVSGQSPLVPMQEFDVFNGENGSKLRKKSESMLRTFSKRGGTWEWISQGHDGKAVLKLMRDGKSMDAMYSVEDATKAKLIGGKNPNWASRPANMLRSRVVSEGLRMFDPESCEGCYTPEEIEDALGESTEPAMERAADAAQLPAVSEPKRTRKTKESATTEQPASVTATSPITGQQNAQENAEAIAADLSVTTGSPVQTPTETPKPAAAQLPKIVIDIIELRDYVTPRWPADSKHGPWAAVWEKVKTALNLPAGDTDEERFVKATDAAKEKALSYLNTQRVNVDKLTTSKDLNAFANQTPTTSATAS